MHNYRKKQNPEFLHFLEGVLDNLFGVDHKGGVLDNLFGVDHKGGVSI